MTYHEKRSILNIISAIAVSGAYYWYAFRGNPIEGLETYELMQFWAKTFLIMIPVVIIARILIMILFLIGNTIATNEKQPKEDEREKLIQLKAGRNSSWLFAFGFVMGMVALVLDKSINMMFVIILVSGILAEIVENISQIYYHRSGI